MAFNNVTFFELHLDGARFGGESLESVDQEELERAEPADSLRRRSRPPLGLLVVLGIGIGAIVMARRMRSTEGIEIDFEDAEAITVE